MLRRGFDILLALLLLGLAAPVLALAGAGVLWASPGPVLYRAARVGRGGRIFPMLKLRSMHVAAEGAAITAPGDPRVFPWGALLRRLKIDELPQLWNVLRGDMAIVGPRPEDPALVARAYAPWMMETLAVRPGLTSPGSIFHQAQAARLIDPADPEGSYVARMLVPKLAIDRAYLERATLRSDLACLAHTALAILGAAANRPVGPMPVDLRRAARWMAEGPR